MPSTKNSGGDSLARGAVRYTFNPAETTQQHWNDIFGDDSGPKLNIMSDAEREAEPSKKKEKK